jgi:hypothetical protein
MMLLLLWESVGLGSIERGDRAGLNDRVSVCIWEWSSFTEMKKKGLEIAQKRKKHTFYARCTSRRAGPRRPATFFEIPMGGNQINKKEGGARTKKTRLPSRYFCFPPFFFSF